MRYPGHHLPHRVGAVNVEAPVVPDHHAQEAGLLLCGPAVQLVVVVLLLLLTEDDVSFFL